jgi:phosphatidylserine/phosphatidylglycerophosphate/cardiolipin synthase-like enzyme
VDNEQSLVGEEEGTAAWLRLTTRRVVASFLNTLARSHKWQRVYLISPWISSFGEEGGMTFSQFLRRLKHDDATAYVVTRPPEQEWHRSAVESIAQTGQANIVLVPSLHTKLYCADTAQGSFALLGSANLTAKSLTNREIGVLISSAGAGKPLVRNLFHEAAELYRSQDRQLLAQRRM